MIQVSGSFLQAIDAGEQPIVIAILSSDMGRRIFAKIHPQGTWTGSGGGLILYDGQVSVGENVVFGSENVMIEADARVLSFGSIRETLTPEGNELLSSLSETEKAGVSISLNNADGYFSDILGSEISLTKALEYRIGYPSLAAADFIQVFSGEIPAEQLNTQTASFPARAGNTKQLEDTFFLGWSSRYANPESQDEILPVVYGDLTINATGGVLKAVCIDTVNFYYLIADHAILSEANGNVITVYEDGVVISAGFTITTSGADENGKTIAYLDFASLPSGDITVSLMGIDDGSGNLLENPIDILEDLLTLMSVTDPQNSQAFLETKALATANSYTAASIILQEQPKEFWVKSILSSFLGDFWHNGDNELVISLDTLGTTSYNIRAALNENDFDLENMTPERLRENICNQAVMQYAPYFVDFDRRFSAGVSSSFGAVEDGDSTKDALSQVRFGVQDHTFQPPWIRADNVASTLQSKIVAAFKDSKWVLDVTEQNFRHCYIEKGDYVVASCHLLRNNSGGLLKNHIWRVLEVERDFDNYTISFKLLDTEAYYPEDFYIYDGTLTVGDYDGREAGTIQLQD